MPPANHEFWFFMAARAEFSGCTCTRGAVKYGCYRGSERAKDAALRFKR